MWINRLGSRHRPRRIRWRLYPIPRGVAILPVWPYSSRCACPVAAAYSEDRARTEFRHPQNPATHIRKPRTSQSRRCRADAVGHAGMNQRFAWFDSICRFPRLAHAFHIAHAAGDSVQTPFVYDSSSWAPDSVGARWGKVPRRRSTRPAIRRQFNDGPGCRRHIIGSGTFSFAAFVNGMWKKKSTHISAPYLKLSATPPASSHR